MSESFDEKWAQFMRAHDELRAMVKEAKTERDDLRRERMELRKDIGILNENICNLVELSQSVLLALQDLISEGISLPLMSGVLNKIGEVFFSRYKRPG